MKQEYANEIREMSRTGYDAIAPAFSRTRSTFWDELLFVRDLLPKGGVILDVGCGNGRFLGALEDKPLTYTGIDFSEGLIAFAKKEHHARPHANFIVGDALALPFQNHTFDVAVSFAVLHHIPSHAYRVQFLQEAKRVITPRGIIVLTAWNVWRSKPRTVLWYALKKIAGMTKLDFGDALLGFDTNKKVRFVHALTMREIRTLAREAGLMVERLEKIRRPSGEENFFVILKNAKVEPS